MFTVLYRSDDIEDTSFCGEIWAISVRELHFTKPNYCLPSITHTHTHTHIYIYIYK